MYFIKFLSGTVVYQLSFTTGFLFQAPTSFLLHLSEQSPAVQITLPKWAFPGISLAASLPSANPALSHSTSWVFYPTCIFLYCAAQLLFLFKSKKIKIKNIPNLVLYLITLITKNRTHTFSFLPLATPKILFTPFTGIAFSKNCTKSPPKMDVYLSLLFLKSLCLGTWQPSPSKPLCHTFRERCLSKLQRKPIEADSICSPK